MFNKAAAASIFSNQYGARVIKMERISHYKWKVKHRDENGKREAIYKFYVSTGNFMRL